ncbi:pilus assembly protein TadG-related protein [Streptomyces sp. MST-110588]|uniref:pilus assembly protein TadG-related protein n=1 Tax=Streptomyces sp. MST-110588 TaxID=2833628 RepID=UPI00206B429E|nr:pilus assembly protein TadG-related protein [Streptomyces sp. MST-110588]UNO43862.1 hypothetical protein KGS77_11930 [Streptomyces sp. MST-110588]
MTPGPDRRECRDTGQAFPIYIVVVAGLLFLAFAFFAVGQAAATRNSAQTAADAAALAAAQRYRDDLRKGLLDAVLVGSTLDDLLNGTGPSTGPACADAEWFAGQNEADLTSCQGGTLPTSFAVGITTQKTVGDSVVPGTEGKHASAQAKAVVKPRCAVAPPAPDDDAGKGGDGKGEDDKGGAKPPLALRCDGKNWIIDPEDLRQAPEASDLFSVQLAN